MTPHAIALADALVRRFEPLRLIPTRDPWGNWTIGYGARWLESGQAVTYQTRAITEDKADALLTSTLALLADQVTPMLPSYATDWEAAACLDFAYSDSLRAFRGSDMRRFFLAGDMLQAAIQFGAWVYAGGRSQPSLVARRKAERDLFAGIGHAPEQYSDDPFDRLEGSPVASVVETAAAMSSANP